MAKMLDLPRELYLIVCSHLSTRELTWLAGVSRDHYLAVQQPLFSRITTKSFSALVKLVSTLTKTPVVSHISSKQRLLWHRLSDSQLRERDIRHLDLTLDIAQDGFLITGAVLERLIGVIARKCDCVKISLTFLCMTAKLLQELSTVSLPNVIKLTLFLSFDADDWGVSYFNRRPGSPVLPKGSVWTFGFSGSTFPDLRRVYMNNLVGRPSVMPTNMEEGFRLAQKNRPRRRWSAEGGELESSKDMFYGLALMEEIKLEFNTFLNADVLTSLCGSSVIPKNLTKLEISNCPALHPIRDLEALATLLQRGLQLLQFLKLHLAPHYDGHDGFESAYMSKIGSHPEHHLCNIIRELGKTINGLDLAVPFACDRVFVPFSKTKRTELPTSDLPLPDIPETPIGTLPQRLMKAGYRYRRLIFNMFCNGADRWEMMQYLARRQGEKVSWELLCDGVEKRAAWLVDGCAPVEFSVLEAMQCPFDEERSVIGR